MAVCLICIPPHRPIPGVLIVSLTPSFVTLLRGTPGGTTANAQLLTVLPPGGEESFGALDADCWRKESGRPKTKRMRRAARSQTRYGESLREKTRSRDQNYTFKFELNFLKSSLLFSLLVLARADQLGGGGFAFAHPLYATSC